MRVEHLTRDPEMQRAHRADRLRHHRISAPLFFGMVEGGEMLMARAGEILAPIVMLVGGQDPIVDPAAAREFYDRLGSTDKTLLLYPKMLHEPLNELGREQVLDDLARWIEPRLSGVTRSPPRSDSPITPGRTGGPGCLRTSRFISSTLSVAMTCAAVRPVLDDQVVDARSACRRAGRAASARRR